MTGPLGTIYASLILPDGTRLPAVPVGIESVSEPVPVELDDGAVTQLTPENFPKLSGSFAADLGYLFEEFAAQAVVISVDGRNLLVMEPSDEWLDALASLGAVDDDFEDEPDCCDAADDDPARHLGDHYPGCPEDAQLEDEI